MQTFLPSSSVPGRRFFFVTSLCVWRLTWCTTEEDMLYELKCFTIKCWEAFQLISTQICKSQNEECIKQACKKATFENRFISDEGISRVLLARDVFLQRDQLETSKKDRNLSFLVAAVR